MDDEDELEVNYAEMEPEYDMEFARYGQNTIEMPMSPPRTPPLDDQPAFQRELSPFSEASSMTSVHSTDSVGYYREEGGRMFPSLPGPIVMPVDNAEMLRVAMQYNLVRLVTGNFYYEEIHEQLTPPHDDSVRVLDVISNSPWIDDMAKEYSHVKFTGCNFVPTRHPHSSNIQLEVYNLHDGFHGKDETYDLIHMLSTFKFSRNFKGWLAEMKRLLKPGGILIVVDLEMAAWSRNGTDPLEFCPSIWEYTELICAELLSQGVDIRKMHMVGEWLRELGGFSIVQETETSIPIGDWEEDELQKEIGRVARENIVRVLPSTHPLWIRAGKTQQEIETFMTKAHEELFNPNAQLFERLFYTFARKEEAEFDIDLPP